MRRHEIVYSEKLGCPWEIACSRVDATRLFALIVIKERKARALSDSYDIGSRLIDTTAALQRKYVVIIVVIVVVIIVTSACRFAAWGYRVRLQLSVTVGVIDGLLMLINLVLVWWRLALLHLLHLCQRHRFCRRER